MTEHFDQFTDVLLKFTFVLSLAVLHGLSNVISSVTNLTSYAVKIKQIKSI